MIKPIIASHLASEAANRQGKWKNKDEEEKDNELRRDLEGVEIEAQYHSRRALR